MVVMSAGVEIYLDDAPFYAREKIVEGETGEHQQALVGKVLSAFLKLTISNDIETISSFFSHQISEIIETPIRFRVKWFEANTAFDGLQPSGDF